MSPADLPLWSTGFYCERADGTGAGGSFDVAGALRHSRGLVRDLPGTVTENQRQAEPAISDEISADPGYRGQIEDAVTFCAYLLPRREAVWWACRCARASSGHFAGDSAAALLAAEAWVKEPDDERRQATLELGTRGHCDDALTLVPLAAGWAGGLLGPGPHLSIPMPPYM